MLYDVFRSLSSHYNTQYPSETLKLQSRDISFTHNLFTSWPIVSNVYTEHNSITALSRAQFQNDWTIGSDIMDERDIVGFEFKMSFGRISHIAQGPWAVFVKPWVSYQIRKFAGCACAGNARNVSPTTDFKGSCKLAIPACITARASRTCRDACRDRLPTVTGKTFPAFPAHAQPTILRIWQEAHGWWSKWRLLTWMLSPCNILSLNNTCGHSYDINLLIRTFDYILQPFFVNLLWPSGKARGVQCDYNSFCLGKRFTYALFFRFRYFQSK